MPILPVSPFPGRQIVKNTKAKCNNACNSSIMLKSVCSALPVQVSNLSEVVSIAGDNSGYALDSSGNVWTWGSNDSGQLRTVFDRHGCSSAYIRRRAIVRRAVRLLQEGGVVF
jgi:hypothetical protein